MADTVSTPSDEVLVHRIRSGDERALGALYDRYADRLFALAVAIVDDPGSAEEAVADAFLRLWREGDHDAERGSVGAYLVTVVRSRALDQRRSRRRRETREEAGAATHPAGLTVALGEVGPPPDRSAEVGETRALVRRALAQISDQQRAVIDLAYFGGMTHREIAEHLSEPLGTIKTRLRDGMKKLRSLIPATARSS